MVVLLVPVIHPHSGCVPRGNLRNPPACPEGGCRHTRLSAHLYPPPIIRAFTVKPPGYVPYPSSSKEDPMFLSLRAIPDTPETALAGDSAAQASSPSFFETVKKEMEEFQDRMIDLGLLETQLVLGRRNAPSNLSRYGDFLEAFLNGKSFTEEAVNYAMSMAHQLDSFFPGRRLNDFVVTLAWRVAVLRAGCTRDQRVARDEAVVNLLAGLIGLVSALMGLSDAADGDYYKDSEEMHSLWLQTVDTLLPVRTTDDTFLPPIEGVCGHPNGKGSGSRNE